MAQDKVHCTGHVAAHPDTVWAVLRDFCEPWHPAIATMTAQDAGQVRAFTVQGEDTLYRERLTWFSDSDRALGYTHLEGIEGAQSYDAWLVVEAAAQGGTEITMSADISATAARIASITQGTKTIFETGLQALASRTFEQAQAVDEDALQPVELASRILDGSPQLGLTGTPSKDGPLCLFLHGIGGNCGNWDVQLGQAGHLVQAASLDLRGYGDSTLGAAQTTVDDYCTDILRVADMFGADKLILCGLSYGSWIVTSFAETYPDRMAGLILSGGCTGMSEAGPNERDAFRVSREGPLDEGQTPADFAPAVIDAISGPNASVQMIRAMTASMAAIPADTYRDALRCFTNPTRQFDFTKLDCPVLMMTGEHDTLAPPSEIKSVATRIHEAARHPDVRFEMIQGAGHVCNIEAPLAFNRPLLEFLRRVVA